MNTIVHVHDTPPVISVLAVWRWYNTQDETSEEAGWRQKEDEAHWKGGSSQRRFH